MIDETAGSGGQSGSPVDNTGQTEAGGERVAFCQQCGRELTAQTVRRVGAAVYCEPCLVTRLGGEQTGTYAGGAAAGYTPVNGGPATGYTAAPAPDAPSPGLAALLGLIPGVGAMYNGQFAKGVAHLVIFAILVSLSDNVNGIFGLFVAGWVVYQSFEAYHTAKARRDGLVLPNAFGLNDIGDRFGFGRNWPGSASRPVTTAAAGAAAAAAATTPPPPATPWQASTSQTPNWAGYVPPTSFGATSVPPPPVAGAAAAQQAPPTTGWTPGPYAPTYAGDPWAGPPPVVGPPPGRRFPVGAAWLIGLGLLFLLSNLAPEWRIAGRWLVPAVFAGLGSWLLYRRVEAIHRTAQAAGESDWMRSEAAGRLLCQVRGPVMLLVLAVLLALQAARVFTLGQTWPVLLVAFGALLLLERTIGRNGWYPPVGMGEARKDGR